MVQNRLSPKIVYKMRYSFSSHQQCYQFDSLNFTYFPTCVLLIVLVAILGRTLVSLLNMSKMLMNRILTQEFKMKCVCSAWVPHLLTQEQIGLCFQLVEGNLKKLLDLDYKYCEGVITVDKLCVHHSDPKVRCSCKKGSENIRKFSSRYQ